MPVKTSKLRSRGSRLRVGVTLLVRAGAQSIWENGIFQNCVFLVQLLNRSPIVEEAVLVRCGDGETAHKDMMLDDIGVRMIDLAEASQSLDVMIEMCVQLDDDWAREFRERGGRYVCLHVGNDYVIDVERALFGKPHASLIGDKAYDAVWTIPEYERSCGDYIGMLARAPMRIVPHLWMPDFIERSIARLPAEHAWGYRAGARPWRVCMFEPNVCMVKTSLMPMLACEEAYRDTPGFLEQARVCNTLHLKENPAFLHFANRLDIVRHGLASFEGRFPIVPFMALYGDCVVSHHWENGQNYLYYELLHGGYPLIHNSEYLDGCGYYYPDFDSEAGGKVLLEAFATHDRQLDDYRRHASDYLKRLRIDLPENVEEYGRELRRLYE